jgi:nucleoside phosphorylase
MFLDEEYAPPPRQRRDETGYIVGRMGNHYVVIAFPLVPSTGSVAIAHTVVDLIRTFNNIRFGLMIGIGGGAPSATPSTNPLNDIHLGDVVVSQPNQAHGKIYISLVITCLIWILMLTRTRRTTAIRQGPMEW